MILVTLHPAAQAELSDAAERYDEQVAGLGERFIRRVEEAIAFVQHHPAGAPVIEGALRGKLISRFPYTVFYSVDEGEVFVLAIGHHKRRPGYWRSRLKER